MIGSCWWTGCFNSVHFSQRGNYIRINWTLFLASLLTVVDRLECIVIFALWILILCAAFWAHFQIWFLPIGQFLYQPVNSGFFQKGFVVENNLSDSISSPLFLSGFLNNLTGNIFCFWIKTTICWTWAFGLSLCCFSEYWVVFYSIYKNRKIILLDKKFF